MLKKVLCGAGVLAASMAVATPAQAAFQLAINDGVDPVVFVSDNGAGDLDPTAGSILFNGFIGGFHFTTSAQTTNAPGDATSGYITTNVTINSAPTSASSLIVVTSADSFFNPGGIGEHMLLSSSLAGNGAGVGAPADVRFQSFADSPGALFGGGNPTAVQSCLGLTGVLTTQCAAAATATGTFTRTAIDYSLTDIISINLAGGLAGGVLQVQGSTAAAVPEPGSMMLLGTGLFGLARVARRRFNLGAR